MKRTKILNFILLVPEITEKTLERSERGGSERNTLSKVFEFFKSNITECGKVCLMDALTEIFSQESTDRKQWGPLKDKIHKKFELLFVNVNYHLPQLATHKSARQS